METLVTANDFQLRAIAPEKKIFLSNFPVCTSTTEIQHHIKGKVSEVSFSSLSILKIEPKSERPSYSSFILNTGNDLDLFKQLVDEKMWPVHSVVHEFNDKRGGSNFRRSRGRQRRT